METFQRKKVWLCKEKKINSGDLIISISQRLFHANNWKGTADVILHFWQSIKLNFVFPLWDLEIVQYRIRKMFKNSIYVIGLDVSTSPNSHTALVHCLQWSSKNAFFKAFIMKKSVHKSSLQGHSESIQRLRVKLAFSLSLWFKAFKPLQVFFTY